jgi:hypothetical protein
VEKIPHNLTQRSIYLKEKLHRLLVSPCLYFIHQLIENGGFRVMTSYMFIHYILIFHTIPKLKEINYIHI